MTRNCDTVPEMTVVSWEYKGIFGRMKIDWVLPAVTVSLPTRAQRRATERQAERQTRSVSNDV